MYVAKWKIAALLAGVGLHLRDSALDQAAELAGKEQWDRAPHMELARHLRTRLPPEDTSAPR